jgi:hypothetical protein
MKRWLTAAAAALLSLMLVPASAAKGTVALVPANVFKGNAGNGPVLTEALRESLEKQGFTVLAANQVDAAVRSGNLDLSRPQNINTLSAIRRTTGADWVVYPRVLSVGVGVNSQQEHQANILVNVVGKSTKSFAHTRQVGQVFQAESSEKAVIPRPLADEAVAKLMEAFYARNK